MAVINFSSISDEAKKRQSELRYLPWIILLEVLKSLGINMKNVKGIDVITEAQRKGGLLRPYTVGGTPAAATEIIKLSERNLQLKKAYLQLIDNINNYASAPILNNPFDSGDINQSKKHPLGKIILENNIKTFAEDVLDAMFFAERDDSGTTPLDIFDGFNTIIDDEVSAGNISTAKGNMVNTGTIASPGAGTFVALTQLVAFIRSADPALRRYKANMYITPNVYNYAIDSLENKMQYRDGDINALERYLNEKCSSQITIKKHEILGSGTRIMLMEPGLLDFGFDNFGDFDFVQVRNIDTDPNIVRFWMQADMGVRLNGTHKKVLCINEQSAVASSISGDYVS